jgi:predicted amidophosphoribosyltransferase
MEEVTRELRRRGLATARLLRRVDGPEQKALNREARRSAVTRSLVLRKEPRSPRTGSAGVPRRIVLIDDVRTTGATLEAAAALLRDGGHFVAGAAILAIR